MVRGANQGGASRGYFYSAELARNAGVSGANVGGVNWGSAAYDPQRHLLFVDTNRLPIFVKLIPRAELDAARKNATDSDRLHGEFARQTGAPYAMFRTPLLAPSGLPCNTPPWGTVAAVDLFEGKKVWDVPLGGFPAGDEYGDDYSGRADGDGWRDRFHRGRDGQLSTRFRFGNRQGDLEVSASGGRAGYSDDILAGWQAIFGDRGWRAR